MPTHEDRSWSPTARRRAAGNTCSRSGLRPKTLRLGLAALAATSALVARADADPACDGRYTGTLYFVDNETKLTWKSINSTHTFDDAGSLCHAVGAGHHYHLPSVLEMQTIVDEGAGLILPIGGHTTGVFWTSTKKADGQRFTVKNDGTVGWDYMTKKHEVYCVKDTP